MFRWHSWIEKRYGKFWRTWLMDRGVPTEEMLEKMRERGIDYLVGTPIGTIGIDASRTIAAQGLCIGTGRSVVPTFLHDPLIFQA